MLFGQQFALANVCLILSRLSQADIGVQETYLGAMQNAPFGRSPYHAEVMVTGVADRMSKHRYQLGMEGAERQRGGRAKPGPRAEAPQAEGQRNCASRRAQANAHIKTRYCSTRPTTL